MVKTQVKDILKSNDSRKEKIDYLWEYYKWHVIGVLAAAFLLIYFTAQLFNRPEVSYQVGILGREATDAQIQELSTELKQTIDPNDELNDILVTATPHGQMAERFFAQLTAGEYDLILIDETSYSNLANTGGMNGFETDSIDPTELYKTEEESQTIGIASEALPVFEQHDLTDELIALIPSNSKRKERTVEFFDSQQINLTISSGE